MTNEEAIQFLKSLPKSAIREVLAEARPTKSSKKIILKGLVTYHNKCLLCDNEWERTEQIQFTLTRTSKPGALITREFTWCDKCSNNLLRFTKEEIVQRAIKTAVKITSPTREVRVYGHYPCDALRQEWDSISRIKEDELQREQETSDSNEGRADEQEVWKEPVEELDVAQREVGRSTTVVALLGWEGGMSI
jgi:hypothetical protein